jgi:S1-C subfamily serine protease
MNLIDLMIVAAMLWAAWRGAKFGLALIAFSMIGFFAGLFLGAYLAPHLATITSDSLTKGLITLATGLGLGLIGSFLGQQLGLRLHNLVKRLKLEPIDGILGAVFEIATILVAVWLIAAPLGSLQLGGIGSQVRRSRIVRALEAKMPTAPGIISRLGSLIEPNDFPRVFIGPEPTPSLGSAPSLAELNAAIAKDQAAVVRIEGRGCGGLVEGSGFVAANGLVATNAHVVAGLAKPVVMDSRGVHSATPVYFDPNLDFAVLRVDSQTAAPLVVDQSTVAAGTGGAVMGYPGGGPLRAVSALVFNQITAVGRNIYGSGVSRRRIYELQTDVEPGNSGGPLIDKNGTVIGVVFAKSQDNTSVGYALTSPEILPGLKAASSSGRVATGACTG